MNITADIKCPLCHKVVTLRSKNIEYNKIQCPDCNGWFPIERHISAQPGYTSKNGTVTRDKKKIRMSKKQRRLQRNESRINNG